MQLAYRQWNITSSNIRYKRQLLGCITRDLFIVKYLQYFQKPIAAFVPQHMVDIKAIRSPRHLQLLSHSAPATEAARQKTSGAQPSGYLVSPRPNMGMITFKGHFHYSPLPAHLLTAKLQASCLVSWCSYQLPWCLASMNWMVRWYGGFPASCHPSVSVMFSPLPQCAILYYHILSDCDSKWNTCSI